jgi:hypothetical protein
MICFIEKKPIFEMSGNAEEQPVPMEQTDNRLLI